MKLKLVKLLCWSVVLGLTFSILMMEVADRLPDDDDEAAAEAE